MCGLVGVAGDALFKKQEDVFRELLIYSSVRGPHSTGAACVFGPRDNIKPEDTDWIVAKAVGDPYVLMDTKGFDRVINRANKRLLMGHNRWATVGRVANFNAHPFSMDGLVGMHNGTLRGRYEFDTDYGTDSEALFARIDKHGADKVIPETEGAWALVWYDRINTSLCMLRNKDRTLYVTYALDTQTIFWASEDWMLDVALMRNGIKHGPIDLLPENQLLTFELFAKDWIKTVETEELKGKEVAAPVAPPFQTYLPRSQASQAPSPPQTVRSSNVLPMVPSKSTETPSSHGKPCAEQTDGKPGTTDASFRSKKGFRGELFTEDQYKDMLAGGCAWCDNAADIKEPVRWVSRREFLCEVCKEQDDIAQYYDMFDNDPINDNPNADADDDLVDPFEDALPEMMQ